MSVLRLASAVVVLLAVMLHALEFLEVFFFKMMMLFTSHTMIIVSHSVVTDLTVCIFFLKVSSFTCELNPQI